MRVVEAVTIQTDLDPWLSLKGLAGYSGLSVRTLRSLISAPVAPLPAYRVGGKILIRKSEFDRWMANHRHDPNRVDRLVSELAAAFRG